MEYTIGNTNLKFVTQEDGHGDFVRGDTVFLCLSESETKALLKLIIDSEQKKIENKLVVP